MEEIKKICFVVPSLHKGGLERVTSILANKSCEYNFDTTIIILTPGLDIEYVIDPKIKIEKPLFSYEKNLIFKFRVFFFLLKKLLNVKPDIIISFSETFNPLAIIANLFVGKKIFVSDRSSPTLKVSFLQNIIKKLTYPLATGIIAQTTMSKKILQRFNKNTFIVPNPIRDINDLYCKEYGKIVVSAGRLVKSKNFIELIKIFNEIKRFDWKLIIAGDGPEYNNLNNYIISNNLINNVILLGKIDDVDKLFSNASIFAFTSLSEGFPNILNEAMSFPLASISFDCDAGPRDMIINNQNGFLIENNNSNIFKLKLIRLMDDKDLRLKFNNESIKNRKLYSSDHIFNLLIKCILKEKNLC